MAEHERPDGARSAEAGSPTPQKKALQDPMDGPAGLANAIVENEWSTWTFHRDELLPLAVAYLASMERDEARRARGVAFAEANAELLRPLRGKRP